MYFKAYSELIDDSRNLLLSCDDTVTTIIYCLFSDDVSHTIFLRNIVSRPLRPY